MKKSTLNSEGYFIKKNFLDSYQTLAILSDLKDVFSKPSINGSIGYNIISKVVKIAPNR